MNAYLLVDGVERDLNFQTGDYEASTIDFFQSSRLYEVDTFKEVQVANYHKHWRWELSTKKLTITHHLEWLLSIKLAVTYMAMLPINRVYDGFQITDTGLRSPRFEKEDLTYSGFTSIFSKADEAFIYSKESGISARVKIISGWDKPNWKFHFSPSAFYNKIYFNYTGPNYTTSEGEVFSSVVEYSIDIAD